MATGTPLSNGKHHPQLAGDNAAWRDSDSSEVDTSPDFVQDEGFRLGGQCQQYQLHCPRRCQVFFRRKYLVDRLLGGSLLFLASPVILALYLLVRATSRGPGFYRQERVGLHGQVFEIIKLRSMVVDAEKSGKPQWACKNDPRVNRVGQVLRKLHLDELPQLWNVCRGDMSLVGPRPERPQICEELAQEIDGYYQRVVVKPGVTGLAQINLPPDETIEDVRRKQILDLHYIENAGLWLDARMMLATALRMVGLKGVVVTRLMCLDRLYLTKGPRCDGGADRMLPASVVRPWSESSSCDQYGPAMAFSMAGSGDVSSAAAPIRRPR
ncbi:sugar transferase [Rhodopirellula sp. SWK7]|uniref:sugar transferase n=1 Tax=Rhodopirellula sp. SWK7 TaxID=595460 RepID=UPI0002BFE3E1|nr:sugar transferase [Rhodopirellula sp. SWK7]EMI44599.1 sugar transferase, PEP-CTERM system associated [Rhodopirellula sp. SWK7]